MEELVEVCEPCISVDEFKPICNYTTRPYIIPIKSGTVVSENEDLKVDCNPMFGYIPKFNFKICNCIGEVTKFQLLSLPALLNGVVKLNDIPVTLTTIIDETNNGLLTFHRINLLPFVDTLTFKVITTCGESIVHTVNINAICTCELETECDECTDC